MLLASPVTEALACGSEPFLGTVCSFGFNFCPRGYMPTDGSLLPIAQNTALFSLLGTTYGGDGRTTFALPDLRGRSAIGEGTGLGLSPVTLGEQLGAESLTLLLTQLPSHSHAATTTLSLSSMLRASSGTGTTDTPVGNVLARLPRSNLYAAGAADSNMSATAINASGTATTTVAAAGGGQPVAIRSPALVLTSCIAVEGIFSSRP